MARNTPNRRDENSRAVTSGVSSVDGETTVMLRMDPITDYLLVDQNVDPLLVATDRTWNKRDENNVPTIYGISSADGVTLVPIRTDINGSLLIENA